MSEIVRIPFRGAELLTTEVDGKPHVILKPAFEAIGLDPNRQIAKVQQQPWATTAVTAVVATDGKVRDMVTADVRTFLMALAVIPVSRVAEHVRPILTAYQCEVADVIERHWTNGRSVNHRLADPSEPVTYTWDEVTAVMRQRYGVAISVPQLTRMLRTAGVLRVSLTEPRTAFRPMFWFCGTHWEVHPHAVPFLLRKVEETAAELREFRFLQARLELDGVGANALLVDRL